MILMFFGLVGVAAAIPAVILFSKFIISRNVSKVYQEALETFLKEMSAKDKEYAPYARKVVDKLNLVNYWLKTGLDTTALEELKESYNRTGGMGTVQLSGDKSARRKDDFLIEGLDPTPVAQEEMTFWYSDEFTECICYCATPEALQKRKYRFVLYYTTAKPSQIPLVFPHKYEGAVMYSLYQHPAQALWFLKNWKLIRENLEETPAQINQEISNELSEFEV